MEWTAFFEVRQDCFKGCYGCSEGFHSRLIKSLGQTLSALENPSHPASFLKSNILYKIGILQVLLLMPPTLKFCTLYCSTFCVSYVNTFDFNCNHETIFFISLIS